MWLQAVWGGFCHVLGSFICRITAPGGTLSDDMTRTEFCLFTAQEDLETMQAYAQVENITRHGQTQAIV